MSETGAEFARSFLTVAEAALIAETPRRTMAHWVHRYGLGRLVGGRLRVDPERLRRFLDGQTEETRAA
jgi:hypothetical protein